jgi:hypothetical protein
LPVFFIRVVCPLFLLGVAGNVAASDPSLPSGDWLVGSWTLCEDPDNSPKETLQFNQDGSGLIIRAKRNVEFTYLRGEHSISLLAHVNGHTIPPLDLAASPSNDRLLLYSGRTHNTSVYVRTDSSAASVCAIQ